MKNIIACSGGMISVDGVPEEIKILPLGMVKSQKGDFMVDDESVSKIIKHFKERKLDLVVDYEHQTLKDIQAPAGGWITELYKGDDAIVAKVKWTSKAADYLKNKEYRYLSPVVLVNKNDKKAMEIHSVALTNTPAIDGMFAIVNSINIADFKEDKEEIKMELKELAKLLGLPETATEEEVKKALNIAGKVLEEQSKEEPKKDGDSPTMPESKGGDAEAVANKSANSVILSLLGLNAEAKTEDVAASIMALKSGGADAKELIELKEKIAKREAQDMVQLALKDGKITAAQKDWAERYALSDKDGFKSFVEKAPVVVPQGKMELKDAPQSQKADYDIEVLKACGISEADVKKYYLNEIGGLTDVQSR